MRTALSAAAARGGSKVALSRALLLFELGVFLN